MVAVSPHVVAVCNRRPATVVHSVPTGSVNAPARAPVTLLVVGAASNAFPSSVHGSSMPARSEAVEALTEVGFSPETFPCSTTFASRCVLFCSLALRAAAAAFSVLFVLFEAKATGDPLCVLEAPDDGSNGGEVGGGGGGDSGGGVVGGAVGVPPTARCWPVASIWVPTSASPMDASNFSAVPEAMSAPLLAIRLSIVELAASMVF